MNSDRLRDLIKAKKGSIASAEELRIRYATERFLLRVQASPYKDKLILKGGFLLGTIYKIENRTTKDLDALVKDIAADRESVKSMLEEIITIDLNDDVSFELGNFSDSQHERKYTGFRAKLTMQHLNSTAKIAFDLDLGVGDVVTPEPKVLTFNLTFKEQKGENERITMYSYPIETVLAEKVETIFALGIQNTRMKDFYDIHLLLNDPNKPSLENLYEAFNKTWIFRHDQIEDADFEDWLYLVNELKDNQNFKKGLWQNYITNREYAQSLSWGEIIDELIEYIIALQKYRNETKE
ncbi:nucleotidyl transferase AbiEii/AbiGii toxin family protein [Enterococcus raffinosus]|uniref:Nucleotidyl transferase AbiEii/AbiGii toxin family protein n=1 Tax=Enterococcus raffinosus TaxID=71452 RepID=A0AAW8SPP0_9ENTE|nr:nucleotidyl transferase AbiEii/AbiGii toxin family protein [Enterococcus raffinosus]MBS6430411.1 nucleotidyl transferase AbiEii/AbiGii toxin family protein [Enterococcus raffinosus]MDK7989084.1 nucleotidyl transferase AbiEii/AbiGii toxin family protein [Enterococcus raffinosus]MDT2536803.1 nucleotidyl transferase AbiEii/AbiGii toxin family protein [Enterococcus raffinosus]UXJ98075.1 nucleotidyl transferase AbiEii/AbiGii toxin family protein [Enterococcus raffinosus]